MATENFAPDAPLSLFVKDIIVMEENSENRETALPFFADGYPGLMFQETQNGLTVTPHNKKMPVLFLYGQTIHPIELVMNGSYRLIVFQLYPFVLKSFFNVDPRAINDNCYDLTTNGFAAIAGKLSTFPGTEDRIAEISSMLLSVFEDKKQELDLMIGKSLQLITDSNGQLPIAVISGESGINRRTFERRFLKATGITAKQFSNMVRFQQSFQQLTEKKDYEKLTDVVYANGFADQSHFIKVFKAFTGKTPKAFAVK